MKGASAGEKVRKAQRSELAEYPNKKDEELKPILFNRLMPGNFAASTVRRSLRGSSAIPHGAASNV